MLGFFTRWKLEREARRRIGTELHRQIKEAFDSNEEGASSRLHTAYCVGYIYWFVRLGFSTITGVVGERATDKHLRHICDGVLPKKLYDIFSCQLAALEVARQMSDKERERKLKGMAFSPEEAIKLYEIGAEAGASDGTCFMPLGPLYKHKLLSLDLPVTTSSPDNLRRFLAGQELKYKPLEMREPAS